MNILLFLKKYQILKFIFSLKSFIFLISFILSVPVLSIPTGAKIIHYYFENSFFSSSDSEQPILEEKCEKICTGSYVLDETFCECICAKTPANCLEDEYFDSTQCECLKCPLNKVANADKTGCICLSTGEICDKNMVYDENCICTCKEGYELWNEICLPICNKEGMSGERDKEGNCICTEDICLCPEGYMVNPDKTCVYCPVQEKGGENCSTLCTFSPADPVGCCKMVIVDGKDNCLEEGRTDFSSVQLVLGNMKGKYRITYISGAVTNSRFAPNPTWFVNANDAYEHRFWISDPYYRNQMPGAVASYPSIEAAEAANKGQSIITQNYRGDVHVAIYRRDGDRWYWYDTSGPGCSDNCGQIKYLFEKISD